MGYHYIFDYNRWNDASSVVSIDTEWAKNWKADIKFIPFCFCFHLIDNSHNIPYGNNLFDSANMRSEMYFRSNRDSMQTYFDVFDSILGKYMGGNNIIVGHQLSSDLHTMMHYSNRRLGNVEILASGYKKRREISNNYHIRDTRYDISRRVTGNGQEKLRSVSLRYKVYAVQMELEGTSLTKLYNYYSESSDENAREKLTVLNWRHAFQTAMVWYIDNNYGNCVLDKSQSANHIIKCMGGKEIKYLCSDEFVDTLSVNAVDRYVNKWSHVI